MDTIIFKKIDDNATISGEKDASFSLAQVTWIQPIIDKNMPKSRQHKLLLHCQDGEVYHYGFLDQSTSPVNVLEITFTKEKKFYEWIAVLTASADTSVEVKFNIHHDPVHIIEPVLISNDPELLKDIYVLSPYTGQFVARDVTLWDGTLRWARPGPEHLSRPQMLHLADALSCDLLYADAKSVPKFGFQLTLETEDDIVTLGFKERAALNQWVEVIREVILHGSAYYPPTLLTDTVLSTNPAKLEKALKREATGMDIENLDEDERLFTGYLHKRKEAGKMIDYKGFQKRWFVLTRTKLQYFKTQLQAEYEGDETPSPTGSLGLNFVLEARDCLDPHAPENCIEIVTSDKNVFVLIAERPEDHNHWIDAISDALDSYNSTIVRKEDVYLSPEEQKERAAELAARREAICKSIIYSGMLRYKKIGRSSKATHWVDRFVVISSGTVCPCNLHQ
jgi:hypothetical protein